MQPARNFYVISISPSRAAHAHNLFATCAPLTSFLFCIYRTVLFITWTIKECVQLRFVNDKQVSSRPSKGRSAWLGADVPRADNASILRYTTASCKQFIECRVQSTVIKHTAGRVEFWPQPVGSLPLAQNAWHCTKVCPR